MWMCVVELVVVCSRRAGRRSREVTCGKGLCNKIGVC